jgi:uncharacterized membrane protein HdeD (DUF308 family)
MCVLGILLMTRPGATMAVIVMFLGGYWFVDGVFTIVESIRGRKHLEHWGWGLFVGVISVFAGLIVFSRPLASALLTTTFLVYMLAFAAIASGLLSLVTGIRLRKEIANEWSMILGGVLYVVFGLFLLGRPFVSAVALVWMFGILAMGGGLTLVMVAFNLRKVGREGQTP